MDFLKLKHLLSGYLFRAKASGLIREDKDERDFETGIFGWGEYTPKSSRHVIKTKSVKNQGNLNTCQWNATTVQKEVDEDIELSVRSLTAYGYKLGLVSGDGYSSISSGQKVLKEWGIAEASGIIELGVWPDYIEVNTAYYTGEANKHRIQSYWSVSSRNDRLKVLDEGRVIVTGIDWYTGYNQGGGFAAPWIISRKTGWKIGGHAIAMIGYDLNYNGRKVYVFQNSYGSDWGDGGKFYIDMDFFDAENYGCYVNLDIPEEQAKKINAISMLKNLKMNFFKDKRNPSAGLANGEVYIVKNGNKKKVDDINDIIAVLEMNFGIEKTDWGELGRYPTVERL